MFFSFRKTLRYLVGVVILLFPIAAHLAPLQAKEHYVVRHYSTKDGMSQNTVMEIMQDKQGFMWFGTWDGLSRFDGYTFETFKAMDHAQKVQVNNRVTILYEDESEQLWWGTYDGHYFRLDAMRKHTSEQPYDSLPQGMIAQMNKEEQLTQVDAHGIIWQADDTYGIQRYRGGQWKRFTPALDKRYAGQLREHFFILEDALGRTWVNPTGGGWSYYDFEQDELVNPFEGLTNMIHTAYVDRDGLMWIATYDGGVDCVNMLPLPYELTDMRSAEHENGEVRAFIMQSNGEVLTPLKMYNLYCGLETRHGLLYGYKGDGLYRGDRTKMKGERIATTHPDIYDIEQGSDDTLYVATYGDGVNILAWNEARQTWDAPVVVGAGMKVRDVEVVGDTLWCGTTNGILVVDLPTLQTTLIPSYDIRAIRSCQGRIWIGSFGGGLMALDPKDSTMHLEHVETFHDIILSMACDGKNLWFTSESDITQLNLETGNLYYYDPLEDERNTYFTEAESLCTPDGKILFGYSNGYCVFDPSRIRRSTSMAPLRFTRIESGGEELYGDTIILRHGSNVTLEYATMDYIGANNIVYSYLMEGIDDEWQHAEELRRVTYTNLHHGTYIFHVRSTNRECGDVDNEQTLYIIVSNPLWLSWWAIMLYILGVLLFTGLTIYAISVYNGLRQRVKVEQQVTDIKLRFFTNVSHELRTPLTLIVAPIDNILQNERISQNVRSQLEIVQSNGQRMLRMVNQLLEFRKVQNQKMKLKLQQTLLSDLVEETSANFRKEANEKHIRFEIENRAEDSTVWVDRQRMDTILWNLLSNAFKFTPSGKSIRVIVDSKPGFVTLAVQDEGVGISPEKRNVLFERFSSNNELNNTGITGTGIGMNLTKELVDLHHGYIEVDSEVGKGTTITILLHTGKEHFDENVEFITDDFTMITSQPLVAPTFEDKMQQLEQEQQDSPCTILVVDDSADMRNFLTNILSRDYHVVSAEDGEKAQEVLQSQAIDLVVTDLMMPKMDGLELTQFIKKSKDFDFIPVILLTAKTAIESRLQALEYGADDYMTKPFEPEYLRARVHNILTQREQLEHSYRQRLMRLESPKNDEPIPGDTFLAKLLDVMERQMDNNTLTVDELVEEMGMGRTVFFNKLKSMTGLSPVEFIREMRIKRAAQLLEERQYNITEVTYMVGMNDSRYFAKCFKNTYGITPSEYRRNAMERNEKS